MYAYAVAVNNAELKQKVKYPSYTLRVMRDETFSAVCKNIHNAAFENLANLGAYGITDPLLTAYLAQVAWLLRSSSTGTPQGRQQAFHSQAGNRASHETGRQNFKEDGQDYQSVQGR